MEFSIEASLGMIGASTHNEFRTLINSAIKTSIEAGMFEMTDDDDTDDDTQDDIWARMGNCTMMLNATKEHIKEYGENFTLVSSDSWINFPWEDIPQSKKWQEPFGSGGLVAYMDMWGAEGCMYPHCEIKTLILFLRRVPALLTHSLIPLWGMHPDGYMPSTPLCEECSSLMTGLQETELWTGPCYDGADLYPNYGSKYGSYCESPTTTKWIVTRPSRPFLCCLDYGDEDYEDVASCSCDCAS